MVYIVMALHSYCRAYQHFIREVLHSYGPYSYGLHSYGPYSYGLHSYGLYSYGLPSYGLHSNGRITNVP